MTPQLFTPLTIGPVSVPNRIAVSPMCQYMADDGAMNDWHLQNLMQLAMSGAGLVMVEATHVERRGRITHHCVGLYNDANEAAMARVLAAAKRVAPAGTVFGIQLAHAGRKGSAQRPWEGRNALLPHEDPWTTVAPSAIPFAAGWHTPEALDEAGLDRIRAAFAAAAVRAVRVGFTLIELHCAHGYLLHNFHSPLSNTRQDRFGGSPENRMRYPVEVFAAVREAVPAAVAVGARITGDDWFEGGITVGEACAFAAALKDHGADYVCVSGGGNAPKLQVELKPGYQVHLASAVRKATGLTTRAVGLITDPRHADEVITSGDADMIALARALMDDPRWVWHAADRLGVKIAVPPQFERVRPPGWVPARADGS